MHCKYDLINKQYIAVHTYIHICNLAKPDYSFKAIMCSLMSAYFLWSVSILVPVKLSCEAPMYVRIYVTFYYQFSCKNYSLWVLYKLGFWQE